MSEIPSNKIISSEKGDKQFEPQKLSNKDIRNDTDLLQSVSYLIQQSFHEISDQFPDGNKFKKEVQNIENTIKTVDRSNTFYIIKNSKNQLLGCLWGVENEDFFFNEELGFGNAFYSKFIGVDKDQRRKGIATSLKKRFEKEAEKKAIDNKKVSVVMSKVIKNNKKSIAWNLKNGYEQYDEGEGSLYYQFYKKFHAGDTYDQIKPGTLEVEKEQYFAMKRTQEIGKYLSKNNSEELTALRESGLTNKEIAQQIIPNILEEYPGVAEVSISYALGLILGEDRDKLTKRILSKLGRSETNIERLREMGKDGIEARIKKYGEAEVSRQRRVGGVKSAEGQGKKVYSEEEKEFVIKLCNNEEYKDEYGRLKRTEIAHEVNKEFRNGKPVRNGVSVADCYRRYK